MNSLKHGPTPSNLVSQRRFASVFWTQALGALNDNLVKNALSILIINQAYTLGGLSPDQMVALCGAIFILPFFLFSATAGQISDKKPKHQMMIWLKYWELGAAAVAAAGFLFANVELLLFSLFQFGLQAAFFGPVKYSILPQLLNSQELTTGTAYVEMATFVAILGGTILGGSLISLEHSGALYVAILAVMLSVFGIVSAHLVPKQVAQAPNLKVQWNPILTTWNLVKISRKNRSVLNAILGVSWFWFLGAIVLSVLPGFAKNVLQGTPGLITYFLSLFSIGIGIGSLLCEKLSFRKLELGLVPFGSIGITVFALDLAWVISGVQTELLPAQLGVGELLGTFWGIRLSTDLILFSVLSGLFIVPLYTLIQERSEPSERSRVIAANNVINALFMVVSSVFLTVMLGQGVGLPALFIVLAVLNMVVSIYIYALIPEFLFRFMSWILANILYRLEVFHRFNIPTDGPAVLVCNHVTFIDWLIISSASPRPIRFVMHHSFLKLPGCGWVFRDARVIPIAGAKEDVELMEHAFIEIKAALDAGELVCIFPEGKLSRDGNIAPFRPGIEKIIAQSKVPVVPMALAGLWGSFFSYDGQPLSHPFRRVWSRVRLVIGNPFLPEDVSAAALEAEVRRLSTAH